MKNTIYHYLIAGVLLLTTACESFLDVKPVDKFLESQVFTTELGTRNAINGIYLSLNNARLYGSDLSVGTIEAMGQRYNLSSQDHSYYEYSVYNYESGNVKTRFDGIWTNAFVTILNINVALEGLETYPNTIPKEEMNWTKGELYGLRALLHFDLYRIFGPMPSDVSSTSLPYYSQPAKEATELLPGEVFLEKVLADLNQAEMLLVGDPIRSEGVLDYLPELGNEIFFRYRNLRFNYYAVKALQARVNLYAGKYQAALEAAKTVIEDGSEWFTWTEPLEVLSQPGAPNTVFYPEIIFGSHNVNMYGLQRGLFASTLVENTILAPRSNRLEQVYENNAGDYRYISFWNESGDKSYKTFYKYEQPENIDGSAPAFKFVMPLIRLSEMYYIAAEALMEDSPAEALGFLNTVREKRGLSALEEGVDIEEEIMKEYQKELFGEGQLFFYYKRKEIASLENGSHSSANVSMNSSTYVVPLPNSEVEFRN
ncbi:RagB/SusD family nutrient uptake outer membrane protein [Echinicola sediminis]